MINEPRKRNTSTKAGRRSTKDRFIDYESLNVLRYEHFQTLRICSEDKDYYIETDKRFIKDVENIAKIRKNAIFQFLQKKGKPSITDQQCNQIDYKARLHHSANVVNLNSNIDFQQIDPRKQCKCGCRRGAGELFGLCEDQQKLTILGPGILLLFLFKRAIIAVLAMILVVYGIFALTTNLVGNSANTVSECETDRYCEYKRRSSIENKDYSNQSIILAQLWLGLIFCIIWVITLRFIKFIGKQKNKLVDKMLRSASDFTIKIQNLPYGSYSQIELIEYFNGLYQKIENKPVSVNPLESENPFKMKSIQIIYNMQFTREMVQQIFYLSYVVDSYLVKPDGQPSKNYVNDVKGYNDSKNKLKQTYELLVDLRKKFLNDSSFRQSISTTCCLIEFNSQHMRQLLLDNYGIEKLTILKQIQSTIKQFFKGTGGRDIIFKGNVIQLERAPEPSDLLWTNCQKVYSLKRKLIIYAATFGIILISFGVQLALEYLKNLIKTEPENYISSAQDQNTVLAIINIAMSIAILVVNQFLWFSLYYLLELEYNHTLTEKIISQMNKMLFATTINTIVVPILTRQILLRISPNNLELPRQSLYASDGLSGKAFDYQLSVLGGLAVKLFDPIYFLKKIVIEIKCLRNFWIRFTCGKISGVDPQKGVNEINKFYQGSYLDVAENYMYMINAIMHAAFFCHLQPFTIVFVFAIIIAFYFINRLKLLRFCQIPEMTELMVFDTAIAHAGLVPIIYGVGSIVVSIFEQDLDPTRQLRYVLIPSSISIFLGLLAFFNPKDFLNIIVKKIMQRCHCISIEKLIGDDQSGEQNNQRIDDQFGIANKEKTSRIQVYYENSNSLRLLGFEKMLRGEQQKQIMNQLKVFCEGFFPKINKQNKKTGFNIIGEKMNQDKNQGILGYLKPPPHMKNKVGKKEQMKQESNSEDEGEDQEMGKGSRHAFMNFKDLVKPGQHQTPMNMENTEHNLLGFNKKIKDDR